jgi:hypothetical protein
MVFINPPTALYSAGATVPERQRNVTALDDKVRLTRAAHLHAREREIQQRGIACGVRWRALGWRRLVWWRQSCGTPPMASPASGNGIPALGHACDLSKPVIAAGVPDALKGRCEGFGDVTTRAVSLLLNVVVAEAAQAAGDSRAALRLSSKIS